ncbi:uncharacterized protein isoform X1 [Choristoneura fumiferana]|uniref:uncharacterized protein isoform X1 n=1 Tax=Choristoneura fumiferana TaxID=7141 RepID=UPI003D156C9D
MAKDKDVEAAAEAPASAPAAVPGAPTRAPGAPPPREPQYGPDGELLGGPHTMQQQAAQRRLQQTQAQIDDVVSIMNTNMQKVLERDNAISQLTEHAEALEEGASSFKTQAASLKNKFWLQNLKFAIVAVIRRPRPRHQPRPRRRPRLQPPQWQRQQRPLPLPQLENNKILKETPTTSPQREQSLYTELYEELFHYKKAVNIVLKYEVLIEN